MGHRSQTAKSLPYLIRSASQLSLLSQPTEKRSKHGFLGSTLKSDLQKTIFSLTSATVEDEDRHRVKLELIHTYRNLHTINRKSKLKHISVPELKYFKAIEKRKLRPETSIFTRTNSQTQLNFQQFGYGDSYAEAVSVALSHRPDLESINFKNNRLHESGSLKILETLQLGTNLKVLNLSENTLGLKSVEKLAEMLTSNCSIEKLCLEKCLHGKTLINLILTSATRSSHLTELSLSRNSISSSSSKCLRALLDGNLHLKVLDLHWNSLRGPGAAELFKGLTRNNTLEVLDLSWNALGRDEGGEVCKVLQKLFGENTSLVHLDLSNNYFTLEECTLLSDPLNSNHTILGLHVEGNDCYIDSKGFLIPTEHKRKDIEGHLSTRLLAQGKGHCDNRNCWLCDRWQAVTFEWSAENVRWNRRLLHFSSEKKEIPLPVFLHLEIDDYAPDLMEQDESGTYRLTRAVPSTGVRFFFTYRGVAQVSPDYAIVAPAQLIEKDISFFDEAPRRFTVVLLNYAPGYGPICRLGEDFPLAPRPIHWVYRGDPDEYVDYVPPWTLKTSIFSQYKLDTEELMQECLDYDWTHSRMSSVLKSQEDQAAAKNLLLPVYKDLFEKFSAYKMTLGSLTDLANELGIVDNKGVRLADLDTNIRATVADSSNIASISRTEFVEIMVRTAVDKYYKTGVVKSEIDALRRLVAENLKPFISRYDSDKWRYERYLTEDCDQVIASYHDCLQRAFTKYSKSVKYGEKSWLSVEEFSQFCRDLGYYSKTFGPRQWVLCYQLSLVTHKDISNSKGLNQMSFPEFMEGFARVVDFADAVDVERAIVTGQWGDQLLEDKLEAALAEMAKWTRPEARRRTKLSTQIVLPGD